VPFVGLRAKFKTQLMVFLQLWASGFYHFLSMVYSGTLDWVFTVHISKQEIPPTETCRVSKATTMSETTAVSSAPPNYLVHQSYMKGS